MMSMSPHDALSAPARAGAPGAHRHRGIRVIRVALLVAGLACAWSLAAGSPRAMAQEGAGQERFDMDLDAVQGVLAIQQIGGWLLYDHDGRNPIARGLARPSGGRTLHRWFYLVPGDGEPVLLVHHADAARFAHLPGRRIEYVDHAALTLGLSGMLRGMDEVAMEYSPMAALPELSRVDAGTVELVRAQGVKVRSSAELVQLTKSVWRPDQRVSHHVAAHHLTQLRKAALAFVAERVRRGDPVTERDVQELLLRGYEVRGLTGPPPVVATTVHAADPVYVTTAASTTTIQQGDLLLIDMGARLAGDERAIHARVAWVAYVGSEVPPRFVEAFAALAQARDAAVALIQERVQDRRAIKGYEVDRAARVVLERAGRGDAFVHRTGHSLDTDLHGGGTNLDDYQTRDTRALIMGAGFAVVPGIYVADELGMRAAVNLYIGPRGVEITTPAQAEVAALLAP